MQSSCHCMMKSSLHSCVSTHLQPTNNLDLEAVVALADAVESFEGGVVVVSHDQYFVGRVAKEVWVVEDGRVIRAESFMAYKKQVLKKMRVRR
jgi:ATP-binding cassette subfamily F protein 3